MTKIAEMSVSDILSSTVRREPSARQRQAYSFERQCRAVTAEAKRMLENISEPAEIWGVHDYLTERRRDVSRVYHFSYSDLDIVFSRLMSDGWLTEADLAGLRPEKIANIRRGAEVFR